jgi:hypothetical protein
MLWKVVQNFYLYIENFGSTRIIKLKLTCKYEILKFIGDLSFLICGERNM